jgi:hypothetical protein
LRALRKKYRDHERSTRAPKAAIAGLAFDVALIVAFLLCVRSAPAQVISWSRAVGAATTLSIGVRVDPRASRELDRFLRPLSPYRGARRPNGAYLLPDTRLLSRACDEQHLRWIGVADWSGPRVLTQAMWMPVGYIGARLSNAPLSIAGMTAYNVSRALIIPGYHIDPLGYAAGIGSWGIYGASLGAHHHSIDSRADTDRVGGTSRHALQWHLPAALAAVWLITFPWSTPWADDPSGDCHATL